ncbi:MAG: alpha-L-fucosidase [Victivallaceae bacterium]|nr:alpha-L-fucosidase [Victivallaceae bacterium]
MNKFDDNRDWFFKKRFGMFIHWGIYAVNAYHEQEQFRLNLSRANYTPLMNKFNPQHFDPDVWLDIMEDAGMEYLTFTTKHIDGFCMWDTEFSDYNIMHTPYGKDVLAILAEACHRRGIPLCLYYSIPDMNHPCYPNQGRAYELAAPDAGDTPDLEMYIDYVKKQVRELCTKYGKIHGFWWDGNVLEYNDPSVNEIIRKLQPAAVINNRGFDKGFFATPERDWDELIDSTQFFTTPVEACESVGYQSWGYRTNEDYHTDIYLINSIDKVMTKGGNYLLNVGPDAMGRIPSESSRILKRIGNWYHSVRESFADTELCSETFENKKFIVTQTGNTLYIHLSKVPSHSSISLKPLNRLPAEATLLNNGQKIKAVLDIPPREHKDKEQYLRLQELPLNEFSNETLVIKLKFDHTCPNNYKNYLI